MSFQLKLIFIIFPFFIISLVLIVFFTIEFENRIINQFEKDIYEILNTVHYSTQKLTSKDNADFETLKKFVEEVKNNTKAKEISVVGSTSEIVASSNPKKIGQKHKLLSGNEIIVKARYGEADSFGRPVKYDFVQVPIIRDNKVIGVLQTSIIVNDSKALLKDLNKKTITIVSCLMLAIFCLSFFLIYQLNKPLRQLAFAAEQATEGKTDIELLYKGKDEIGKVTKAFNLLIKQVREQKTLQEEVKRLERHAIISEMASNLAHEIRNPLNLINLTADHLIHEFTPLLDEEKKKKFSGIILAFKEEINHLNKMVAKFLSIKKPLSIKKAEFFLSDLISQVELLIKQRLVEKQITFEIIGNSQIKVIADIESMRIVFLNLLLNSIEAVNKGGKIIIKIEQAIKEQQVIISFIDNGPGIAKEDIDKIFEPYFTKKPDGMGLGLALVKRIINQHEWKIQASNNPQGGAKFDIIIPNNLEDKT